MSSSSSQKGKRAEIIDTTQDPEILDEEAFGSEDDDDGGVIDGAQANEASTSQKKKKKKKSKAAKALNALRGKKEIPQEIVDVVLDKVKVEHGEGLAGANEAAVRQALEQLKIMDVVQGKAGLGGHNKKDMGEHKFWATQPVPQPGEGPPLDDGFIEPSKPPEEVRQEPYPLPKDFEWVTIDLSDPIQIQEVHSLLSINYIEDKDASFRFQYSAEFLHWALTPPGYHKEWHVGVRVSSNKKLVAFISGVPVTLRVREHVFHSTQINYLCVHKKLRSKRLAPVLIKEVTRQCHLKGIFQAIYTAGVVLPTPVSVCRYYHRSLNVPKLVDVQFAAVPRNMTVARMVRLNKLPSTPQLDGLREMEERDIPEVAVLYSRYMQRFDMVPVMSIEEVQHQFLSGKGTGESVKGRREGQVTWTYVVENPDTHKITDFFSFYSLPSSIMKSTKYELLEVAYLYYYATGVGFQGSGDVEERIKKRVRDIINDAVIVADQAKFDVFNALTLMDNVAVLKELKFGPGDGFLNFYLYNWRTAPMAGFNAVNGSEAGRGVGVVML